MQHPDDTGRAAVVAVHDISPATWRECRQLLERLDAAGVRPLTLLIVPDYHHRAPVGSDPAFVRALGARHRRFRRPRVAAAWLRPTRVARERRGPRSARRAR